MALDSLWSYLYGLLLADGTISLGVGNKGRVSMEVAIRDVDIVERLVQEFPGSRSSTRTRSTNYKSDSKTATFRNSHLTFRSKLIQAGFPTGAKSSVASVPSCSYDEVSFWRGFIDGDGSLGINGLGTPYVSFITKSPFLKESYCEFMLRVLDIPATMPLNSRDNIFVATVLNEDAQALAGLLYGGASIYINRKKAASEEVLKWVRTKKKLPRKRFWSEADIAVLQSNTPKDSSVILGRSMKAINIMNWRMHQKETSDA